MAKSKYFKSREEFIEVIDSLIGNMKYHDKVGAAVARAKVVVKFEYSNPEASVTVNAKERPSDPKAYFEYSFDETGGPKPDVTFTSSADYALRFWQGKENAAMSLATGKLKAKGNPAKALALLPAIKPTFKIFPKILKEAGREHMIVR